MILCHLCVSSNSKSSKTTFFARFFMIINERNNIAKYSIICISRKHFENITPFSEIIFVFCKCIYLFIYSMAKKDVNRLKIMLAVTKHSNKWLAEMLGKDQATISKWCTNTCQPDLETLIRISDLLKVDVNDLLNKECIKE